MDNSFDDDAGQDDPDAYELHLTSDHALSHTIFVFRPNFGLFFCDAMLLKQNRLMLTYQAAIFCLET